MAGPASLDVKNEATTTLPFVVVKLTPEVVQLLAKFEPNGLSGSLSDRRPPSSIRFGIGDIISVTIFEKTPINQALFDGGHTDLAEPDPNQLNLFA